MIIHTRNEHQTYKLISSMQSIICMSNTQPIQSTQGNCIKDIKSNKGTGVMYLKKCITLTTSTKLQSMGTKKKKVLNRQHKPWYMIILSNIGLLYLLFFNITTPPLIKLFLPLSSSSPPFCHGIASPHFLLPFFEFDPIEFGEKWASYYNGCCDGVGERQVWTS